MRCFLFHQFVSLFQLRLFMHFNSGCDLNFQNSFVHFFSFIFVHDHNTGLA